MSIKLPLQLHFDFANLLDCSIVFCKQLKFEARKIEPGFEGDIAIDDILFMNRPCEGFPTVSQCTFEQGPSYCSIRNSGNADTYWLWYDFLASEKTPLPDTGMQCANF